MSTSEVDERSPLPRRLVVPTVYTGEVGLVMTVFGIAWERAPHAERRRDLKGYWSVLLENGDRYVLPEGLHGWARNLDNEVRQRLVRLPAVYAFAQHGGDMTARILSAAQNG